MPPTFHIVSMSLYTPKVFRGILKADLVTWCHRFGLQHPPKSAYPKSCPWFSVFFVFFWQHRFYQQNSQLLPIACHTYSESYCSDGSFELLKFSWPSYDASHFADTVGPVCKLDLTLHLKEGWRYQSGWFFGKNPNGLQLPPPFWTFTKINPIW